MIDFDTAIKYKDRVVEGHSLGRDETINVLNSLLAYIRPQRLTIIVDETDGTMRVDGEMLMIGMPYMMVRIIKFLADSTPRFKTRNEILEAVSTENFAISDRTIDTHIKRFRKMAPKNSPVKVVTRYGIGYSLQRVSEAQGILHHDRKFATSQVSGVND